MGLFTTGIFEVGEKKVLEQKRAGGREREREREKESKRGSTFIMVEKLEMKSQINRMLPYWSWGMPHCSKGEFSKTYQGTKNAFRKTYQYSKKYPCSMSAFTRTYQHNKKHPCSMSGLPVQ